ncbi:hypothetical protein LXL04_007788 [Taraxacum kok-saghyz]
MTNQSVEGNRSSNQPVYRSNSYYLDIDIKDLEQIVITVTLNSNLPKIWTTIGHIYRRHTVLQLRWFTYLNFDFKKEGGHMKMICFYAQKIFGNRWTEIAKRITSLVSFKVSCKISKFFYPKISPYFYTQGQNGNFIPYLLHLYVGAVIILCSERRSERLHYSFIDTIQSKGVCEVPFTSKEIVVDFYNELKSITSDLLLEVERLTDDLRF